MARLLYRLGQGAARRRWWVLIVWVAFLASLATLGIAFGGTLTDEITIPGIESQRANDLLAEEFPAATAGTIRAVFAAPESMPLADPVAQEALTQSLEEAGMVAGVLGVTPFTPSAEGTIGFADIIFTQPAEDVPEESKEAVQEAMDPARDAGLQVEFGGSAMTGESELAGVAEVVGVIIAAIVLFITLRTLIAAGLPLGTAFVGVAIGLLGVQFVAGFTDLPDTTTTLATMLGLAVGIDYALFIVSRHRTQMTDPGVSVAESIGRAIGTSGSAVVFAGLTVVIALCALAAVQIPFLTAMGLAAAATVAIAVIIALTLVPALLAFGGERLRPRDAERKTAAGNADASRESLWGGWARLIQRGPALVLIVGSILLVVVSLPVLDLRLGLPSNAAEPEESTLHQSYDLLTEGFGPGFNATITYVIDATDIPEGERDAVAAQVAETIRQDPGIAAVADPVFNEAHTVSVLLNIIPLSGPNDEATTDLVERLRDEPAELIEAAGGDPYVTGTTAVGIDISAKLADALPIFIAIIVVLALALLLLAFRSIIVPLKAVTGFLLTIGSSMGLTVLVFQQGHLADFFGIATPGPIVSFMPILLIGILFGLAMDYEVFLVSGMREHFHHSGDASDAVVGGLRQSGGVVTAAALIMTAVFGGFLFTPDPIIKPIAFALAVGVLIDAFIVRMTLVPAAMELLGQRAWSLPPWLERVLPNVDIEGASLPQHSAPEPRTIPVELQPDTAPQPASE